MTKVHIQKILALSKILQVIWENNLYKETEAERNCQVSKITKLIIEAA